MEKRTRSIRTKGVIYGVGIVDVDYKTQVFSIVDGKRKLVWVCPFYEKWKQMIRRCFSEKEKEKNPTYANVTCCDEWISLSNFKRWMESQSYLDKSGRVMDLDKDLLVEGNLVYSPSNCVFIPHILNSFIFNDKSYTKNYPLGVTYVKREGKFQAQCNDPFNKRSRHICYGNDPEKLHQIYLSRKHQYACELADSEYVTDERVAKALRGRYSYGNWYDLKETTNDQPK